MKLNQLLSQAKKYENDVVATGFRDLDKVIGGLPVGHICAVAGRPAMGKTAFAMNIAKNIGIFNKIPTVIFSIEDSDVYVMTLRFPGVAQVNSLAEALVHGAAK